MATHPPTRTDDTSFTPDPRRLRGELDRLAETGRVEVVKVAAAPADAPAPSVGRPPSAAGRRDRMGPTPRASL